MRTDPQFCGDFFTVTEKKFNEKLPFFVMVDIFTGLPSFWKSWKFSNEVAGNNFKNKFQLPTNISKTTKFLS